LDSVLKAGIVGGLVGSSVSVIMFLIVVGNL